MFGKKPLREIWSSDELQKQIDELKGRIAKLESQTRPARVGEYKTWFSCLEDTRPELPLWEAINLLRRHLKLEWTATAAVPATIQVTKERK